MKKTRLITLMLVLCGAATSVARSQQQGNDRDASMSVEMYVSRILDAIKTKDSRLAEQLMGSLVMKNDDAWFTRVLTPEIADAVKDAYGKAMKDFVKSTRELYAADIQRGPIHIRVHRNEDASFAPPLDHEPLYEVALFGERPTFQIALPPDGGKGRVVAGDLQGYFLDTVDGFRFIPSNVLQVVQQEQQKNKYEVLDRDSEGRPTRIRISSAALAGMIIERVPPEYPRSARQKKIQGEVQLSVVIGTNGRVKEATALSGPAELYEAAVETMKKWRFKPFQLNGRPIEVEARFFALNYAFLD
jgi:TonB family protein